MAKHLAHTSPNGKGALSVSMAKPPLLMEEVCGASTNCQALSTNLLNSTLLYSFVVMAKHYSKCKSCLAHFSFSKRCVALTPIPV